MLQLCEFLKQADHLVNLSIYLEKDEDGNSGSFDYEPDLHGLSVLF